MILALIGVPGLQRADRERELAEGKDPGIGMDSSVALHDMHRMIKGCWDVTGRKNPVKAMRTRAVISVAFACALRWSDVVRWLLTNIKPWKLEAATGPTVKDLEERCKQGGGGGLGHGNLGLLGTLRYSKTNQVNNEDAFAMLRHRDVEVCPVGSIALALLTQLENGRQVGRCRGAGCLHWDQLDIFSFLQARDIDFTELVRGGTDNNTPLWWEWMVLSPDQPLNYQSFSRELKKLYKSLGIVTSKVTHLFRHTCARTVQWAGFSDEQVAKVGRWADGKAMSKYYLDTIDPNVVAFNAGHKRGNDNSPIIIHCPRAQVVVPDRIASRFYARTLAKIEEALNQTFDDSARGHRTSLERLKVTLEFLR